MPRERSQGEGTASGGSRPPEGRRSPSGRTAERRTRRASTSQVTVPTGASVAEFVARVPNATRRRDAERLIELMTRVTGQEPVMWGPSIVGFGSFHYRSPAGREGEWPAAGFSPRSTATTVYLEGGFAEREADALARLGPHTTGVSCLYIKRLDDVDLDVLEELVRTAYEAAAGGSPPPD